VEVFDHDLRLIPAPPQCALKKKAQETEHVLATPVEASNQAATNEEKEATKEEITPTIQEATEEACCWQLVDIPCKGKGVVAQRRIFPGEVIMKEKPWIVIPDAIFNDTEKTDRLLDKAVSNMNSTQIEEFLSLSDCQNPLDPTYLGILYTNSMNYDGDAALFPQLARVNHSCRSNAEFSSRVDLGEQRLVANYTIEKGEEVTINYMSMAEEGCDIREVRQAYLREYYNFQCTCRACTLQDGEHEVEELVREEIKELQAAQHILCVKELYLLIDKLFSIKAKLSYICDVMEMIYRESGDEVERYRAGVRGLLLAINLYGEESSQANTWRSRLQLDEFASFVFGDGNRYGG